MNGVVVVVDEDDATFSLEMFCDAPERIVLLLVFDCADVIVGEQKMKGSRLKTQHKVGQHLQYADLPQDYKLAFKAFIRRKIIDEKSKVAQSLIESGLGRYVAPDRQKLYVR
eukprot:m.264326 g.264326  ORF g.264326 m.264326 type:complete len:112 (+) comp54659_c1_seq1:191-526(+)